MKPGEEGMLSLKPSVLLSTIWLIEDPDPTLIRIAEVMITSVVCWPIIERTEATSLFPG